MRNHKDYEAGWTTKIINPKTGKQSSGGAARALRTAQAGGNAAIEDDAFLRGVQYVLPVVESYKSQLEVMTNKFDKLVNQMQKALITTHREQRKP